MPPPSRVLPARPWRRGGHAGVAQQKRWALGPRDPGGPGRTPESLGTLTRTPGRRALCAGGRASALCPQRRGPGASEPLGAVNTRGSQAPSALRAGAAVGSFLPLRGLRTKSGGGTGRRGSPRPGGDGVVEAQRGLPAAPQRVLVRDAGRQASLWDRPWPPRGREANTPGVGGFGGRERTPPSRPGKCRRRACARWQQASGTGRVAKIYGQEQAGAPRALAESESGSHKNARRPRMEDAGRAFPGARALRAVLSRPRSFSRTQAAVCQALLTISLHEGVFSPFKRKYLTSSLISSEYFPPNWRPRSAQRWEMVHLLSFVYLLFRLRLEKLLNK